MIDRKLRDRYELQEHLGDGSTATVFKAVDSRLGREVALKILLPHVSDSTRERFFQEATAVAQLNHPNIMSIFDADEDDGQHFLVVEYVEGVALSTYVPSTPDVVTNLGQQIALALHYAHERQIIHRDIKPANIKVTPGGQVKIMDLGLALPSEAKRVTEDGMIIGTPAYISPEQAQGLKLDHRTDIYSLGVVLYEMATGRLPFDADDINALLLQQVRQPPPPLRLHVENIPLGLENVILKALEKKPVRRFQSCRALASALQAATQTAPASDMLATGAGVLVGAQDVGDMPKSTLRLILADDHALLRQALANLLEQRDDFIVIAEAGDGEMALTQTLALLPDVLVLDLNMPGKGGLEVLLEVRSKAPNVKVLVLTGRDEDQYIVQALRSGAHGYLLKSTDESELLEGIVNVTKGHLVLGHGVAERIVLGVLNERSESETRLNDVEKQLLLYIAGGYENDTIATRLDMPITEVIETLAHTMNKLGAKDRHAAALYALRRGIISLDDLHTV